MGRNNILVQLLIAVTAATVIFANDPLESSLFSVTYDKNCTGETETPVDDKKYKAGDWFSIKGFSQQDTRHFFSGWNSSSDGKGTYYKPNSQALMGNSDLKLYAQWVSHGITKQGAFRIWNNPFKDLRNSIVQGNYLYYLSRATEGLDIVNLSQDTPKLAGGFRGNDFDFVENFTIEKNRAYLASSKGGLQIIDISNPLKPTLLGKYGRNIAVITVHGRRALASEQGKNGDAIVHILDIDNSDSITVLGTYAVDGEINEMFIHDTRAYIVLKRNYPPGVSPIDFLILNIANPAHPDSLGCYNMGSGRTCPQFQVAFPYAYFVDNGAFQILNIKKPMRPYREGCYTVRRFKTFRVIGRTAFLLDPLDNLHRLNISDPARPEPVLLDSLNCEASFLCAEGSTVYAFRTGGLSQTRAKKPCDTIPGVECRFRHVDLCALVQGFPRQVRTCPANDYVYCARGGNGMMILDMQDPHLARLAANHPDTPVDAVSAIGGNLLIGTDNKLSIADLKNPLNPQKIGTVEIPDGVGEISSSGHHAIICTKKGAVSIINFSNPSSPVPAGSCNILTKNIFTHCAAAENYLYLTDLTNGVYIVDIKDPLKPRLVGKYHEKMEGKDFKFLKIFAVADHIMLSYSYFYKTPPFRFSLGIAQVNDGTRGKTTLIDAGNPAHPVQKQNKASRKAFHLSGKYDTWTSDQNNMETGDFLYYNVLNNYDCESMNYPYFCTIEKYEYNPEFIDVKEYKIWR
jgi:hypothetical protein